MSTNEQMFDEPFAWTQRNKDGRKYQLIRKVGYESYLNIQVNLASNAIDEWRTVVALGNDGTFVLELLGNLHFELVRIIQDEAANWLSNQKIWDDLCTPPTEWLVSFSVARDTFTAPVIHTKIRRRLIDHINKHPKDMLACAQLLRIK